MEDAYFLVIPCEEYDEKLTVYCSHFESNLVKYQLANNLGDIEIVKRGESNIEDIIDEEDMINVDNLVKDIPDRFFLVMKNYSIYCVKEIADDAYEIAQAFLYNSVEKYIADDYDEEDAVITAKQELNIEVEDVFVYGDKYKWKLCYDIFVSDNPRRFANWADFI